MSSQLDQASDSFMRKKQAAKKKLAASIAAKKRKSAEKVKSTEKAASEQETGAKAKKAKSGPKRSKSSDTAEKARKVSRQKSQRSTDTPAPSLLVQDRRDKRRVAIRDMGACGFSIAIHVILLVALGMIVVKQQIQPEPAEVVVANVVEEIPDEEELKIELEEDTREVKELTDDPISSSQMTGALGAAPTRAELPRVDRKLIDNLDPVPVNVGTPASSVPSPTSMIKEVPAGSPGDSRAIVDDYAQAMDRITQEILWALDRSEVLVVWLFDQSESMKDDQKEIRERINRVYAELGLTSRSQGEHLLTAVTSFGRGFIQHTRKPTADLSKVKMAIDRVPIDPSGKEMMTEAIGMSIRKHREYTRRGRRQMMLVVVSDESGDRQTNHRYLEDAIAEAKAANCRCYFLGREAVFGYPYVRISWKHPQTENTHWLLVDRGPETAFVEQLQTSGFRRRYDAFPSGFGPYEQTRMARETGGIFFLLPSLESKLVRGEKRRYELDIMQSYKPDLRSRMQAVQDRNKYPMRALVWKVVNDLNPYNEKVKKIIELRHAFAPPQTKGAQFLQQVAQEQAKARVYLNYLAAAQKAMEEGIAHREQEISPRWQANYDLIYAQIVAYQARVFEYGAALEAFKRNPKVVPLTKPPNQRLWDWHIHTRKKMLTGEVAKPYVDKSRKLFQAVIKDHPGTPWAARAKWELGRGWGVGLHVRYRSPPKTIPPNVRRIPVPKL